MTNANYASETLNDDLQALVEAARQVSDDVGAEVDRVILSASADGLDPAEMISVLRAVVEEMRRSAKLRRDDEALSALESVESVVQLIAEKHSPRKPRLTLQAYNGIQPSPVKPTPCFQGRLVQMNGGFVQARDIDLWDENDRLQIHLAQFAQQHGRKPRPDELLEIMLTRMPLPGVSGGARGDQFEILELARSVAQNGVRKPPIVDLDGTLLDGNRRVAACRYILESDEFTSSEKARAQHLYVWQLTEHATDDDRRAVVVSLNFEQDCKQEWPAYVKARKIAEDWEAMLLREPMQPGRQRSAEMKKELSKQYALGPNTNTVNLYLRMVKWSSDFEDHHESTRGRDHFEVQHRANKYFQYFDEISKGATKPGGVAYELERDDHLRHLVYDLLYDGKFTNFTQIRPLKYVAGSEDARDALKKARDESDVEDAQEHVTNALALAKLARAEERELGANTRIEGFVKWLEQLPVRAFRDQIKPQNLARLVSALQLVRRQAEVANSAETEEAAG